MIGVGTRYSDFTTSNETLWQARPEFVNINICNFDVSKQRSFKLWGDARRTLEALLRELEGRPLAFRSAGSGVGFFKHQRLLSRDPGLPGRDGGKSPKAGCHATGCRSIRPPPSMSSIAM